MLLLRLTLAAATVLQCTSYHEKQRSTLNILAGSAVINEKAKPLLGANSVYPFLVSLRSFKDCEDPSKCFNGVKASKCSF